MGKEAFVLENSSGEITRFIDWTGDDLFVVQLKYSKRVIFVSKLTQLQRNKVEFTLLDEVDKKSVRKKPVLIKGIGRLKLIDENQKLLKEVQPVVEEDKLKTYAGYSAAFHVGLLAVIMISAFVWSRFFADKSAEPVIVQIIEPKNVPEARKNPTVAAATKKVKLTQPVRDARVANRTKIVKNSSSRKTPNVSQKRMTGRPGAGDVGQMGALGVLGGYSKKFNGSGGTNLNAKTNNPGIGNGGVAARGGHERGLLGSGLVSAGIGPGGGPLKGYGGTGTSGLGGGRPGYGTMKMAGNSGAFFEPLGEESLVEGGLDQDQINAVIQRNIGQVIYCYEQGLQSKPNMSGRVAVKFVISGSGHVTAANIANTSLSSRVVESCIVGKLKSWKFPQPVGRVNVRVTYPFLLKRLSQG